MTNELQLLSNDLNVITAEVKSYQQIAGQAVFEIGRRLKVVRDNAKEYGLEGFRDWEVWCAENCGFSRNNANRLVKIVEELGDTYHPNLGANALYLIATLPEPERIKPHIVPSTGEIKTVNEMTVRELREVKKALKESEQQKKVLQEELEHVKNENHKEVIEDLKRDVEFKQELFEDERMKNELLEQQLYDTEKQLRKHEEFKRKLKSATESKDSVGQKISATTEVSEFMFLVEDLLQNIAPVKYSNAIMNISESKVAMENLLSAVNRVESWCKEVKATIDKNNVIDMI